MLDARGSPLPDVKMVSYAAGVHLVDEDTAECARKSGSPVLFVTDVEPVVVKRDPSAGPLSWEDIRLPADGGFYIQEPEGELTVPEDPGGVPLDWPCGVCHRKFPSEGARNRHREFNHKVTTTVPD